MKPGKQVRFKFGATAIIDAVEELKMRNEVLFDKAGGVFRGNLLVGSVIWGVIYGDQHETR